MNQRTYDISLLAGMCLVVSGAWAKFGPADAALIAGAMVIVLTLVGAAISGRS